MKEAEIINEAYAAKLQESYTVFSTAYIAAQGDANLQQSAEKRFEQALRDAKKVKERALAVMLGVSSGL